MFENKTEAQARKEILALVAEYADRFHNQKREFKEGDRIPYASRVYDKDANTMPTYKKLHKAVNLPAFLLSIPNNMHSYYKTHNKLG